MFNTLLYQPFLNTLMYLYQHLGGNLGLAIIVFTIIIKLILAWPSASFIRSQRKIQALQPKLQALKRKHQNDREGLSRATMALYKESKVNPFTSCLPTLIQLPILFALYKVFLSGLQTEAETGLLKSDQLELLYGPLKDAFASTPINTVFFPGLDLAQTGIFVGSVIIAALAGVAQYWQSRMIAAPPAPKVAGAQDERLAAMTSRQMTYLFPIITVVIIVSLPIGLGLYWLTSILFTVAQQYLVLGQLRRQEDANANHPQPTP
ncbi:MAG: membrane protein insertase YidC [Candidatus Kerfeldbacteria bacterium]|nr:membrane protein insertase YidC [Candidatus Kerfeldbacteria bacterium]